MAQLILRGSKQNRKLESMILVLFIVFAVGPPSRLKAQSGPGDAQFEVASIHPSRQEANPPAIRFMPGGGIVATNVTLNLLIQIAYDIRPDQLSGGPGWADSAGYDIDAKQPARSSARASDVDTRHIARMCLQALLAERFKLIVQRRSKNESGYALVVAKNGPKFTRSNVESGRLRQTGIAQVTGEGAKMDTLAKLLTVRLGEDVMDRTGLTDRYDFTLSWILEQPTRPFGEPEQVIVSPGPSIFSALQEQLGLKLEPQKNASDLLAIEHAERPTEN